ncbi:MAG: histidine--tRNA ligase [Gaiellaceae bacterium]
MSPFEAPRGTHDILPAEQPLWRLVLAEAESLCVAYGYQRIQTPGFEDTELFRRTSGAGSDVVQKEMYTFTDRADRSLTLRPEGTAPIARAYLEHGLHRQPQPQKLYTIATMYRYAAPQRGRWREHWQLSVEAIGSADPAIDAELIQLYAELLGRLGLRGWKLRLNSIGDRACRPQYLERLASWLDEHEDALDEEARNKRATSPLRVFDVKNEGVLAALADAPKIGESLCAACRDHFDAVQRQLERCGVPYELAPTLVRGLDYYTRTAFEFVDEAIGAQSSICGGGRYDYLVEELDGPATPGIGFGAGLDRLMLSLRDQGIGAEPPALDVFFAVEDAAARPEALAVMAGLRRAGLACDTDYAGRSLKGQLTQAGRANARVTVIVRADGVTVRERGEPDVEVTLSELAARLSR